MPKKLVPNPEYRDAPYEFGFRFSDGRPAPEGLMAHRFKTPCPDMITQDELLEWIARNSISTHIEVDS